MQRYSDVVADSRGNVMAGASVLVELSGVTATIYSDDGVTLQSNPMTTDVTGAFTFYAANGTYTLRTTLVSGGTTVTSRDTVVLYDPASTLSASTGAGLVGLIQSGTGSVARTVQDKERDVVSVFDFMTSAQIADVRAGTLTLDVAAPIQAVTDALIALPKGGAAWVPVGQCGTKSAISVPAASGKHLHFIGAGMGSSWIVATGAMNAVFDYADVNQAEHHEFRDLTISGGGFASYGIRSAKLSDSLFSRIRVMGTTTAAMDISYGWDNVYFGIQITANTGNGLVLGAGGANNAANIQGSAFFGNDGIGIKAQSGKSIIIRGNTIETNKKAGIYAVFGCQSLVISDNYFEGNAVDGLAFATPAETVHADIIINGSASSTVYDYAYPCLGVVIDGNSTQANGAANTPFIKAISIEQGQVTNNISVPGSTHYATKSLLDVSANSAYASVKNITLHGNSFASKVVASNWTTGKYNFFSSFTDGDLTARINYVDRSVFAFSAIAAGGGGTFSRAASAERWNGQETYALGGAANTDLWGISFDAANYPDLQGQIVWFGAWHKVRGAGTGTIVGYANTGSGNVAAQDIQSTTSWQWYEFAALMPSSGTVAFSLRQTAAGAGDYILLSGVSCGVVGANAASFNTRSLPEIVWRAAAAPTVGTWEVNNRVLNVTPAVGQPKAWACTVAGAPGTWVSEGNL